MRASVKVVGAFAVACMVFAGATSTIVPVAALAAAHGEAGLPSTSEPRLYLVRTQTGMPHLEANLRYAVRESRQCLRLDDLSTVFWMLEDVSLQDCRLHKQSQDGAAAHYELRCHGGHGTTGEAMWRFEGRRLDGTLRVRLGGKNMTFHQHVTADVVGAC